MPRSTTGHKAISRIGIPTKNEHGWYVRLLCEGKMHCKYFSDSRHGGKDRALEKALKYRNALEKQLGQPRTERSVRRPGIANKTGFVGVSLNLRGGKMENGQLPSEAVFEATWCLEVCTPSKTPFPIDAHGEKGAFLKAVRLRQQMERKIYGRVIQTEIPPFAEVKARLLAAEAKRIARKAGKSG